MTQAFLLTHDPLTGLPIEAEALQPRLTAKAIIAEVARDHGVTPADLIGRSLKPIHYNPRRSAIKRIRIELGYSLNRIGQIFDNRDHSTIAWALKGGRKKQPWIPRAERMAA